MNFNPLVNILRRSVSREYLGHSGERIKISKTEKKKRKSKKFYSVNRHTIQLASHEPGSVTMNRRRKGIVSTISAPPQEFIDVNIAHLHSTKVAEGFSKHVKRSAALVKLLTKLYLNSVPLAFLKWKTQTLMKKSNFGQYVRKTKTLSRLLEKYLKFKRDQAHRFFYYWKFQSKLKFPFYIKSHIGRQLGYVAKNAMKKNIKLTKKIFSEEKKVVTILDVLGKMNDVREILDKKFKSLKRSFFEKIKIYYAMEKLIINSKKPLLIRNLRLNEKNFYKNLRKYDDVSPAEFMKMLDGKNKHEHSEYAPWNVNKYEKSYFRMFMTRLRRTRETNKSSSTLLLTGVWSTNQPYLRFRETYTCHIFQKNYQKKIYIAYLKLLENTKIQRYAEKQTNVQFSEMKEFDRIWGKISMHILFKDSFIGLFDATMRKLEIHKRLCRLIDQRKKIVKHKELLERANPKKKYKRGDLEKLLEESYSLRMSEVQEYFPRRFMKILVSTKGPSREVKREIIGLLFDTVFYLLCDVIQQARLTQKREGYISNY